MTDALAPREAVAYLAAHGVSTTPTTLAKARRQGRLQAVRDSAPYLYEHEELLRWAREDFTPSRRRKSKQR